MKKTLRLFTITFFISLNVVLAVPAVQNGYQVQLWYSSSDAFQGIRVGKGAFGAIPYVANYTSSTIIRVTGKNTVETFATGLNSGGYAKIAFDESGVYDYDMYVASPYSGRTSADPIYRINSTGSKSVFSVFPTSQGLLTNGVAFGKGGGFGNKLYVQNAWGNLQSFNPDGTYSTFAAGNYGDDVQDDLLITSGGTFGINAYMTAAYGQILRMSESGIVDVFASGQGGIALAMGSGNFGDYLFLGTIDGNIYKYDSNGAGTLFASGFGQVIRGLDISGDSMWITASDTLSNGNIYQIIIPEPATLSLLVIGGFLMKRRK